MVVVTVNVVGIIKVVESVVEMVFVDVIVEVGACYD